MSTSGHDSAATPGDATNDVNDGGRRRRLSMTSSSGKNQQQQQPRRHHQEDGVRLKRELGLFHGIGIVAGLVIGGGIYLSPRGVLVYAGSPGLSLILWAVGGLLTLFGALTYAEIGLAIPESGALYAYMRRLYGPFGAFLYLWSYLFFVRVGANAIKCLLFGRYILKPFFPDCQIPESAIRLVATLVACVLTTVNCVSVKMSARGQSVMTVISLATLALISISGVVHLAQGSTDHLMNAFEGSSLNAGDWTVAVNNAIFSYYGWSSLNYLIEELKRPERNLPLSIIISVSLTTVLYVSVNYTYLAVLGSEGVLQSEAVAISLAAKTLGPIAWLMPVLIAITSCSSFNSGMMVASRLSFAGSRSGHLPEFLSLISVAFFTPITSLVVQCLLILIFIWTVEVYSLIQYTMFINLVFDWLVVVAYIRWRLQRSSDDKQKTESDASDDNIKQPELKMPIFVPILYSLIVLMLVAVPLITKPLQSASGLALMLGTGIPYYIIVIVWTDKPASLLAKMATFTRYVQKLFYCIPQEVATGLNNDAKPDVSVRSTAATQITVR